jgi:hypothetical protein
MRIDYPLFKLSQLLHDGRCHSIPTQLAAHPRHTSMQLSRSAVELSFANIEIRSSGGRRPIGGITVFLEFWSRGSRKFPTPTEDCESLAWAMKKSVSSSTVRSGEVDDEDSEGTSLEKRSGCRERGILDCGCEA